MRAYGPAALRLSLGAVFAAHGAQKLFGILGGQGVAGTARLLTSLGVSYATPFAVALGVVELAGGLLLILGGLTLWVTLALLVDVGLTVWKVHYRQGLTIAGGLMPGHSPQADLQLVMIAALVCLMLNGPGALSIDRRRSQNAEAQARNRARIRKV